MDRHKPLLLIVEDDAVTRLMLSRFLQKQGCDTQEARDGAEAISLFEQHPPDIVLMDAKMPVMDGFAACQALKRHPEGKHVPVIMITALDDDESVDLAFQAGAIDFITKPIHWAILRNRVRYLIQAVASEKELFLAASVFESTNEGIVVTDGRATIQSVNPAFCRITGYTSHEIVGRPMSLLKSGRHDDDFYRRMWTHLQGLGKWQGEIWNRRKNGEVYPEWLNISAIRNATGHVTNFVGVFTDLTAIKESEESLAYVTGHDPVTNLPNRLLFHERLQHAVQEAKRQNNQVAVLLLDLDRFKVFNETLGHDMGDRLLALVGHRIAGRVPSVGTLARLGGDEFGIVCPMLSQPDEAAMIARGMLSDLSQPFVLDGLELSIGGSLGIAIYPLDGHDEKSLLKNADAAMYHAKEQGRNNFQFFRSELNIHTLARVLLESGLRSALERGEFLVYYQPQLDLITGRPRGMEALIRWRHPEKGMVSPGEFIPLAEESGLIIPIGEWVLTQACLQTRQWMEMGFDDLTVAVNLSGIQFRQPHLDRLVASILETTGLPPKCLELELTESTAMKDVDSSLVTMSELSAMGIRLSLDDFGTGFSSLSYLKRFPIRTLKVDQTFVRNCTTDPDDASIIRSIIGLAHNLGLEVVAEGVETQDQLAFLHESRCDVYQGYLFSRPLPADQFTALLQTIPRPSSRP